MEKKSIGSPSTGNSSYPVINWRKRRRKTGGRQEEDRRKTGGREEEERRKRGGREEEESLVYLEY